jgi:transcriptional regulator with XRE-family HTH domain
MAGFSPPNTAMNAKDEQLFKALGARIAQARKAHELTQQQLASQIGIAQQTLAHYEGGRLRPPVPTLIALVQALGLSLDELLGQPATRAASKRGPASKLQQQFEAISQLPKAQQRFVSEMLDAVLAQAQQ